MFSSAAFGSLPKAVGLRVALLSGRSCTTQLELANSGDIGSTQEDLCDSLVDELCFDLSAPAACKGVWLCGSHSSQKRFLELISRKITFQLQEIFFGN